MSVKELAVKFRIGRVVVTPGSLGEVSPDDMLLGLGRHICGDWGDLGEQDWRANDDALENGGRLFSQYSLKDGSKFWIITECDRSVTTILLPNEY